MCKAAPEISQLWILHSSWHPEPKPCPPRAEPGSCFNQWCPSVTHHQLEAREASFCAAPWLCRGFSRRLAMTHSSPCPLAVLRSGGHASKTLPGWRAHCTQLLLHQPSPRAAPRRRHSSERPGSVPVRWEACKALRQLSRWAIVS